jgi:hypothetical protein
MSKEKHAIYITFLQSGTKGFKCESQVLCINYWMDVLVFLLSHNSHFRHGCQCIDGFRDRCGNSIIDATSRRTQE